MLGWDLVVRGSGGIRRSSKRDAVALWRKSGQSIAEVGPPSLGVNGHEFGVCG